jgi:hypothetical protein
VQGFFTTFLTATCKPRKLDGEIHYLDAVSYLGKHRPDRELPGDDDAGGGFFLHSHVRLHDAGAAEPFSLTDCDIVSNYDYRFYLKDSRLAIAHTRHKYDYDASRSLCSGFLGNKGFADTLADALQLDIENEFFKVSSTRQLFTQPFSDTNWDCALGVPGGDACARAAAELQLAIGLGDDVLGIPGGGPGSPADRLVAAAQRPENWQCTNYPTPPDACRGVGPLPRGRCEYIVRAKRLNVTPDTVELVWFDDVTEYDNPTFALFVASFAPSPTSNQVDFQAYRRLCSRNPSGVLAQTLVTDEPNNYYNRHFTRIRVDDSRCDALPREPPPDPPECPCSSDRDCPTGVTCDLRTRLCKDLCFVDANCVFPQWQCYPELSRCGGSQCVNHAMCHSYEFCHSSGHCMKRR